MRGKNQLTFIFVLPLAFLLGCQNDQGKTYIDPMRMDLQIYNIICWFSGGN